MLAPLILAGVLLVQAGDAPTTRDARPTVWAERAARFFELWEEAPPERRKAAARAEQALLRPGTPRDRRPGLEELLLLTRVLEGEELAAARADELWRLASGLDLRVVPGLFASDAGQRGQALVVHVQSLVPFRLRGELELVLHWLGPRGERVRARAEPFPAQAFAPPGFPVYVRAPAGQPGDWLLVPELRSSGRTVSGTPVSVTGIRGGEERVRALATSSGSAPELVRLFRDGERWLGPTRPADLLEQGPSRELQALRAAFPGLDLALHSPPGALRAALVFLAPEAEPAGAVLHGPLGSRWLALADRAGLLCASLALRPREGQLLRRFAAALQELHPALPLIAIARADAALGLHWLLAGDPLPLSGIVLSSSLDRPGPVFPDVPTLIVCAGSSPAPAEPPLQVVPGASSALLSEPLLPGIVEEWLASVPIAPPPDEPPR